MSEIDRQGEWAAGERERCGGTRVRRGKMKLVGSPSWAPNTFGSEKKALKNVGVGRLERNLQAYLGCCNTNEAEKKFWIAEVVLSKFKVGQDFF